jgi:hypothetical protein
VLLTTEDNDAMDDLRGGFPDTRLDVVQRCVNINESPVDTEKHKQYTIIETFGRGGFSDVHEVEYQIANRRQVCAPK